MKKNRMHSTVAMLGAIAAMGALPMDILSPEPTDHSRRDSNRYDFGELELKTLASLSGKEKKKFLKELKAKHSKGSV